MTAALALAIAPLPLADFDLIWPLVEEVAREGATYPLPRDLTEDAARAIWSEPGRTIYIARREGRVVGSYYLRPNSGGPAAHVANAGYMVRQSERRHGIAKALFEHSLQEAVRLGFKALQFNLVVSTNTAAVHLWQSLGMEIVGTLPRVFQHPDIGFVDAYVMYRWLGRT